MKVRFSFKGQFRAFGYNIKLHFALLALLVALIVPAMGKVSIALDLKDSLLATGATALGNIQLAKQSLSDIDFSSAQLDFDAAYQNFVSASDKVQSLGTITLGILEAVPGVSGTVNSGKALLELGERLTTIGRLMSESAQMFAENSPLEQAQTRQSHGFTATIRTFQDNLALVRDELAAARSLYAQIDPTMLPSSTREQFAQLGDVLPALTQTADEAGYYLTFARYFLGETASKKYLLVFQNNSEIRATGGFIGTYGILDLDRGIVKNLLVDGVYNIDGQLAVDVKPPRPLQKITAGWSFHDSNWFFDFPSSAREMMWFYEKTGATSGTVDGVIAITPALTESLLAITGPIPLPQYDVTLNADNFIDLTQQEVEQNYDKGLNRPKQILTDLTTELMTRMKSFTPDEWRAVFDALVRSLQEKQILVYLSDPGLQSFILRQGWGGGVLKADRDYLAVVNSNINGYKTDRVVEQSIQHNAVIDADGQVTVTLTIHRDHNGGDSPYPWYNKVNADYMRVYVPLGSRLIDARGHTIESYQPRKEYASGYQAGPFADDPLVSSIESNQIVDPFTGTDIFEEAGKTVFGNWVYVSPGKEVTVVYTYVLPFRVNPDRGSRNYSLLVQKQPGARSGAFRGVIEYPVALNSAYVYPETLQSQSDSSDSNALVYNDELNRDLLYGTTFTELPL